MNRRNFLRNSIILGALGSLSPTLWANPTMGRTQRYTLPEAPLHIRHGLLQGQSVGRVLSNCQWFRGLEQNVFLRNGVEEGEQPFQHYRLQLEKLDLGIGRKGEQLWLCEEQTIIETTFPSTHQIGAYQLSFERLDIGDSYRSDSTAPQDWLLLSLSEGIDVNGQSLRENELFFVEKSSLIVSAAQNARFVLIRKCG
jgi:hypothetical protein